MNHFHRAASLAFVTLAFFTLPALAQEIKLLQSFENDADIRTWEFKQKSAHTSTEHATQGQRSIKIAPNEYLFSIRPPKDWSGYDALEMDIFVEGDAPVGGTLLIGDADWNDPSKGKGSYWNRHNGTFNLKPGANTLSIPVNGLFRGEAGSRNNDLKYNIDTKSITRLDIGFKPREIAGAKATALYLDNFRLSKESRPAGILAFDLGPANQQVFPGFTAIGPQSIVGKEGRTAGLSAELNDNAARDDTFPTRLYRDAIALDGASFIATVPEKNTKYHAWVVYDDLGYWGGEAASYRKRSIISVTDGQILFTEDRGAAGPTDYLYRFEKTEPKPTDKLWDLYVAQLFTPKSFAVTSSRDGKINLRFTADSGNSCRVAAIVLYPDSSKEPAEKWLAEVEQKNRAEFESRAVYLGSKAAPPESARPAAGLSIGFPSLEEDLNITAGPGPADGKLDRIAARGQRVSFTFAVRAGAPSAPLQPHITDLRSASGDILPAAAIDLRYVHRATRRGFNDIAYTIAGESLRKIESPIEQIPSLTRQFWITVAVPLNAAPGRYTGQIHLRPDNNTDAAAPIPVTVDVQPFTLDEPDFMMGYYGTHVPRQIAQVRGDDALRDLFRTLREAGMNSLSGGPSVRFTGYDAAGKPLLDFAAADTFMKLAREAGFTKPLLAYGGPGMIEGLHDTYIVGETGKRWEKKLGKPFPQILSEVWAVHRDHAKAANWLPVMYEMCDEPRVLQQAAPQVELMKLYRQHAPWVDIGGSYSVEWHKNSPFDIAVQDMFKTLNWSALNLHTQDDLDMAKKLGKGLQIYNQGRTRYSFGAYQWAEFHKGVSGRMQWHLLALHGYQFFDLDGREPDTAMINWGKEGVIPTIHLPRCREGADDFRYAVTLWNLASTKKDHPAAKEAIDWLEAISKQIPLDQNRQPTGFMDDESFRAGCAIRIRKLQ